MHKTPEETAQALEEKWNIQDQGCGIDRGDENWFLDISSVPTQTDADREETTFAICNLVTKYGRYRLTIPCKTWQANVAILSALKNMEALLVERE